MGEFVAAALGFPTVLFSFLLVVVVGFWLLVLLGGAELEALDSLADGGALRVVGFGGVPATIGLSLAITLAWFVSLAGSMVLDRVGSWRPVVATGLLVAALGCAWLGTRLVLAPLRRLFTEAPAAVRADFVGRLCVVRTGRVDLGFGQAEVTAADGSSAVVQVRMHDGEAPLGAGDTALIYEYDGGGEFFWITAYTETR